MVDISILPKYTRLNHVRPPLQAEPVEPDHLVRLGLPRYQPAVSRRGRSRKRGGQPADAAPQSGMGNRSQPAGSPAPLNPAQAGSARLPGGFSTTPPAPRLAGRQPDRQPVSPYEKRAPFNTSLPPRSASGASSRSASRSSYWSKGQEQSPSLPSEKPVVHGSRLATTKPAGGSAVNYTGPQQVENSTASRRTLPEERSVTRPTTQAPAENSQSQPKPAQPRPYRLPPLDFSFAEPANAASDSLPDEARPTAKSEGQTRPPLEARPERPVEDRPMPSQVDTALDDRFESEPPSQTQELPQPPSLRDLLLNADAMPSQTAFLGVCADGLPILLNLNDPSPGSLLVVGDERQHALDLLRLAVISVALRNTARGMQFLVFSHQPEAWERWIDEQSLRRYCLGVAAAEPNQAREWIYRLSEWVDQRAENWRDGPPVMVLFDTLSFLNRLSPDTRNRLNALIRGGPDVRIWSIAAISTALAGSLHQQLDGFDTRIWGHSEDSSLYTRLAGVPAGMARGFSAPGQFAVQVGPHEEQTWLKFRLPSLEGLLP